MKHIQQIPWAAVALLVLSLAFYIASFFNIRLPDECTIGRELIWGWMCLMFSGVSMAIGWHARGQRQSSTA
jgi:hypothetical protein